MTRYVTQWDADDIGATIAGWTERNSGAVGRTPKYGTPAVKRRYLNLTNASAVNYGALSWDAVDGDAGRATFDVLFAFKVDDTTAQAIMAYARGAGSMTDGYRVRVSLAGASLSIDKLVASAGTSDIAVAGFTWTAGRSFFVRFQGIGTALKAKAWDTTAVEPTAWTITVTDSGVSAAGWIGLQSYHGSLTGMVAPINFFSVGTGGDTAVAMLTNADYYAWLDSPAAVRRVLADMSAVGYDSAGSPFTKTVNAYIANGGYTTKAWDTPASRNYPPWLVGIPTLRREMNLALSGRANVGFGSLVVDNSATDAALSIPAERWDFRNSTLVGEFAAATPTVTRAGNTATRFNSSGLLETINANLPRYDYDPVALTIKGLLIEEARTNECLQNRDLTNAAWTKTNTTAAKDQTGIDGAANGASSLTATAANGTALQAITSAGSVARRWNVWMKRLVGTGAVEVSMDNGVGWTAVTSQINGATYTRVAMGQTLANPTVGFRLGTNTDKVAIDFCQEEQGAIDTSNTTATAGATVTRAADVVSLASLGSWFNAAEGTLAVEYLRGPGTTTSVMVSLNDGSADLVRLRDDSAIKFDVDDSGVPQAAISLGTAGASGTRNRVAASFKANQFQASANGGAVGADTAGTMPTLDRLHFGHEMSAFFLNGHLVKVEYFREAKLSLVSMALTATAKGVRDDWLRMKWKRDYVSLYLGDETWPKHDFRTIVLGNLDLPTAPQMDRIEFPIADLLEKLDKPLQTTRYASTDPMANQLKPVLSGAARWAEPVPSSTGTLELQFHDGSLNEIGSLFDDGINLFTSPAIAISAVDTGTETLSTATSHGLAVDARVVFSASPAPPAGLTAGVQYYVISAGLTTTNFRVSAARGGAAVNLTGSGTGATFDIYGWWEDLANGKVTLVAQPAGRIMGSGVKRQASGGDGCKASSVIDYLIFTRYALSTNFKDTTAFDQLRTDLGSICGILAYDENLTALDWIERISKGTNTWYGFTQDGLLQVGRLALPSATAVMNFTDSDVKEGSLKLTKKLRPINRATLAVRVARRFVNGSPLNLSPATTKEPQLFQEYSTILGSSWPAAGIPLDDRPNQSDVTDYPPFDSLFYFDDTTEVRDILEAFYLKTLGVFTFETRLGATRLSIGETISLTHPREGWKSWGAADPSSPDNTDTIDSTKAVVIGIDTNLAAPNPFPVKLTVFRQIPGDYSIADLN